MRPSEVFFITELPDDKNTFNVAIHNWQRKQRWLKIKLAGLLFFVFSCLLISVGGIYVTSKYVRVEKTEQEVSSQYVTSTVMVNDQSLESLETMHYRIEQQSQQSWVFLPYVVQGDIL